MLTGPLLAIVLHHVPAVRRVLDPLFATYYAIPVYAFYPLLMVVFGLGDLPQIAVGFLLAVVAVLINTLNGLDRVPPVLLKVARVHR
jgi:NitT/TauT family transport system permease protein